MKKTIIFILVGVIILAAGIGIGYKVFSSPQSNNQPKDGKTVTEEGATVDNGKVNSLGVKAYFSDVAMGSNLFLSIDKYPERWRNALKNSYGMSDKTADSLIKTPEEWLAFNLFINIDNPDDKQILVGDIEVKQNGKNGLYFQKILDGQHIIEKNVTSQITIAFFLEDNEPSLEEVTEMIKNLDIYVNYVPMPEDIEAEIPAEDYQCAKVEF